MNLISCKDIDKIGVINRVFLRNTIQTSRAKDYLGPYPFDVFNIDTSDVRE